MKIKHATLKNVKIATTFGTFQIDNGGVVEVPDDVAEILLQDTAFIKVEAAKKTDKKDEKEPKESK